MKFIKPLIGAAAIVAAFTSMASAQSIVHRYEMNGNANDSVGTATGTVVGGTFGGGAFTPTGGQGMSLPTAAVAGLNNAFTIECWYTWNGNGEYQTVFSFSDNTQNNFLINVARRGNESIQGSAFRVNGEDQTLITGPTNQTPGTSGPLTQIVITFDGISTGTFYVNGVASMTMTNINPAFDLSVFTKIGIGGNSPYPDPSVGGTISDFRIYNGALTAGQVTALNGLGADASNGAIVAAIPEPSTIALLVGAGVAGLVIRRRSRA